METQQKAKQYKSVAVALVRDEEGNILLTKPTEHKKNNTKTASKAVVKESWEFPANDIIPGATYTETFVSEILEKTGCIIEAVSLISSEKFHSQSVHVEYVECKVVCRDSSSKTRRMPSSHRWVHPAKVKTFYRRRMNKDIAEFLGL